MTASSDGLSAKGDIAVLASRQQTFTERSLVHFYMKVELQPEDVHARLNVRLVSVSGTVTEPFFDPNDWLRYSGWRHHYSICIPAGTYGLNFEAVCGANTMHVTLDAVTISPGCCRDGWLVLILWVIFHCSTRRRNIDIKIIVTGLPCSLCTMLYKT